ncbi:hypothetical protein G3570_03450 [Balneolaceae bacterium YR4-1]|uniref:Uncharacterized protein n=1 Tax=Halalkalibaculum roseum TaxID=2709311 RepID=A0A6M1SSE2_9BACT|nr:hypothetical protein [Halalkalibaculum roseum]NGP75672.1 hypothetical protein [Halalkalibaculum roseum]
MMPEPTLETLENTLADINQIDPAKGRSIMTTYDKFTDDFRQVIKFKQIGLIMEKAGQYYFNKKEILEMNLLFTAYCKIKASNLSNEDLKASTLDDYTSGNTLTLEGIEQRLMALGWMG